MLCTFPIILEGIESFHISSVSQNHNTTAATKPLPTHSAASNFILSPLLQTCKFISSLVQLQTPKRTTSTTVTSASKLSLSRSFQNHVLAHGNCPYRARLLLAHQRRQTGHFSLNVAIRTKGRHREIFIRGSDLYRRSQSKFSSPLLPASRLLIGMVRHRSDQKIIAGKTYSIT